MRPDLFAGHAPRDESYRILARLANGGSVPAPARPWGAVFVPQRRRLAAIAALLLIGAAAWIWQPAARAPALPSHEPVARAPAPLPAEPVPVQAAAIFNEAPRAAPVPAAQPPSAEAALRIEPHVARPKAAPAPRPRPGAPATENDEDVTLLTAMLRHANPQKASPRPPKER